MTPGSSSCNWRLMTAHWSCPVLQMWLLRPQGAFGILCGQVYTWPWLSQEDMVALALAEEQLGWFHRACVAQDRDRSCKKELVNDHADRNQHTNEAGADDEHGRRVGRVYAHDAFAISIRVTELDNDPEEEKEDKHELDDGVECIIAPLAKRLSLHTLSQVEKRNE